MASARRNRSLADAARKRPGLFGGNTTFRYVLIAVILCFAVVKFYDKLTEKPPEGPINDIFVRTAGNLIVTWPDSIKNSEKLADYCRKVAAKLSENLGQVVRTVPESRLGERQIKSNSIIIYSPLSESVVARSYRESIPFCFGDGTIDFDGTKYGPDDHWRMIFLLPNPLNDNRYSLFYTAASIDDLIGINFVESPNFLRGDKTDYILGVGDSLVVEGFFKDKQPGLWQLGN